MDIVYFNLSTFLVFVTLILYTNARRHPAQLEDARRLPQGFFDDARDGSHVYCLHLN
jgi:hypothetical protein